ncbi:MAG: Uma2 family endonuclease, partial [Thermosynechococcaceae cyanobacterium]
MAIATTRPMTFAEYLDYDDGTDTRYELVDGILVEMGAETDQNVLIALFLIVAFARVVPLNQLRRGTEIEICPGRATSRYPDFMVLTAAGAAALSSERRSLIRADMPAPALVVEVVSPGEPGAKNYDRDYVEKRQEYAERGIPE